MGRITSRQTHQSRPFRWVWELRTGKDGIVQKTLVKKYSDTNDCRTEKRRPT